MGIQLILIVAGIVSLIFIWMGMSPHMRIPDEGNTYGGKPPPVESPPKQKIRGNRRKGRLKKELHILGSKETVQQVLYRQWIFGSIIFMAGCTLGLWTLQPGWLFGGIVGSWMIARLPARRIHAKARQLREEWDRDLPLLQLSILQRIIAGLSPYEAIVETSLFFSGSLQGEMNRLVQELRITGDVPGVWKRWADRLDSPQALRFAALFQQMMIIDTVGMDRQLRAAYRALRREQREAWRKKSKQLPGRLQWPNMILFMNIVMLPVIGVGLELSQRLRIFL